MRTADRKVVLVTGASQGIGAGLVAAFGSAGYRVVATSRSIQPTATDDILAVQGDVTDAASAGNVVDRAVERFGRIDSLVNNAGIFLARPFTDYTVDDFDAITAVNLAGFFHITQRAIGQMLAQGGGHVVTITTSLVDHASSARPSALTSLTKGGLDAVTRALATEYAARGIRVNAVAPGVVRTELHDPASYEGLVASEPLGRVAEVGDIADAILYLERATFVTGETLRVDGGWASGH